MTARIAAAGRVARWHTAGMLRLPLLLVAFGLSACAASPRPAAVSAIEPEPDARAAEDCHGERSYARITDFPANLTAPPLLAMFRFEQPGVSAACGRVLVRR